MMIHQRFWHVRYIHILGFLFGRKEKKNVSIFFRKNQNVRGIQGQGYHCVRGIQGPGVFKGQECPRVNIPSNTLAS